MNSNRRAFSWAMAVALTTLAATLSGCFESDTAHSLGLIRKPSSDPGISVLAAPVALVATEVSGSVHLSWDAVVGAERYLLRRAELAGKEMNLLSGITLNHAIDSSVIPGHSYYYTVQAFRGSDRSVDSEESFVSIQIPVPAAPMGLNAATGDGFAVLAWQEVKYAKSYKIFRSSSHSAQVVIQAGVLGLSYVDHPLTNGETYSYQVEAENDSGSSGKSAAVQAIPQVTPPSSPKGVSATAGENQVALKWDAVDTAKKYQIFRSTTSNAETFIKGDVAGTNYTDASAKNGTTYYYTVKAVNDGGISTSSAEVIAKPRPDLPNAPKNLSAQPGDSKIILSWDKLDGATQYTVSRGIKSNAEGVIQSGVTALSFTDSKLKNGTRYFYKLVAYKNGNPSPESAEVVAIPQVSKPSVPSNFKAVAGNASVSLTWDASPSAESYVVIRHQATGAEKVIKSDIKVSNYTDATVKNGGTYFYVVYAVNDAGTSARSVEVSASPKKPLPAAPGNVKASGGKKRVTLSWDPTLNAASFKLYRGTVAARVAVVQSGITNYSVIDSGLDEGKTYYYRVSAVNDSGEEGSSSALVSATTTDAEPLPPTQPQDLKATAGDHQVSLNWTDVSGATGYVVKRGTVKGTHSTSFAAVTESKYVDSTAVNGTTYYYVVVAKKDALSSADSAEVSAQPAKVVVTNPSINYPSPDQSVVQGQDLSAMTPVIRNVESCSVSPALPQGVALNTQTCMISGKPKAIQEKTAYTVKGVKGSLSASDQISITVTAAPVPAPRLVYSSQSQTLTVHTAMTEMTPTNTGGPITSCSHTGTLPDGIDFSAATCKLSGTPVGLPQNETSYTINAHGPGGDDSAEIKLTVNAQGTSFFYPGSPFGLKAGEEIKAAAPSLPKGVTVQECRASPVALPAWLSLSGDCILNGKPTVKMDKTSYQIFAKFGGVWISTTIFVEVTLPPEKAPIIIGQKAITSVVNLDFAWAPEKAVNSGVIRTCAISPDLPSGVDFDHSTCAIKGKLDSSFAKKFFKVTASNDGGSSTLDVSLEVVADDPIQSIQAVGDYQFGITTQGRVYQWGTNRYFNWPGSIKEPVLLQGLIGVKKLVVSNGYYVLSICGQIKDGTVQCLGSRESYSRGKSNFSDDVNLPTLVEKLDHVVDLVAGAYFKCALTSEGEVKCWGNGDSYSAFDTSVSVPTALKSFPKAKAIYTNGDTICAISQEKGEVWCLGYNGNQELGYVSNSAYVRTAKKIPGLDKVSSLAMGSNFICAIRQSVVSCWGNGEHGQLGDEIAESYHTSGNPTVVMGLPKAVKQLKVSGQSACALTGQDVYCWGQTPVVDDAVHGSEPVDQAKAKMMPRLPNVLSIESNGMDRTFCAVIGNQDPASDRAVRCWGSSPYGIAGAVRASASAMLLPHAISGGLVGVEHISLSSNSGCALKSGPKYGIFCWGKRDATGTGSDSWGGISKAQRVVGVQSATAVETQDNRSCALLKENSKSVVRCWGDVNALPIAIQGLPDHLTQLVSTLGPDFCALSNSGEVWCFGVPNDLILGGEVSSSSTPTLRLAGVASLYASPDTVCAIMSSDHSAQCWGSGKLGQLGNGFKKDSKIPVSVMIDTATVLKDISSISMGGYHSCAISQQSKSIYCWGVGTYGQLGSGTRDSSAFAVKALGTDEGVTVKSISAGAYSSCAILSNHETDCWGYYAIGGSDKNGLILAPHRVDLDDDAIQVVASNGYGSYFDQSTLNCAVLKNGAVQCWGSGVPLSLLGKGDNYGGLYGPVYVPVLNDNGAKVTELSSVSGTSCATLNNGKVLCWGKGANGRLGSGRTASSGTPTEVAFVSHGGKISQASDYVCSLNTDQTVQCWGDNTNGALGGGVWDYTLLPLEVKVQ